jgi:hypothetical protein
MNLWRDTHAYRQSTKISLLSATDCTRFAGLHERGEYRLDSTALPDVRRRTATGSPAGVRDS